MNPFLERIEKTIRDNKLFRDGQSILVAVSGGLDSMALLHLLHQLSPKFGWKIAVAHFNHQLRGKSSDADEQFVRKAAAQLKLPIVVESADVKKFARANKLSVEMAARKLRHEFLARVAQEGRARQSSARPPANQKRRARSDAPYLVALAHHKDDQIELFFLRLLRGSGGEGLSGMKWRASSPANSQILLVRPLLEISKKDLENYAKENEILFREDASNSQLDFQRNRIRHDLLPLLRRQFQPALTEAISRSMEILSAETDFVTETARTWLQQKERAAFATLPIAVQRRCIQLQLFDLNLEPNFSLIEELRTKSNFPVSVNSDIAVYCDADGILELRKNKKADFNLGSQEIKITKQGKQAFAHLKIFWQVENGNAKSSKVNHEFFDADKIGLRVVLRHWRTGDRFQPIGMKSPQKLHDLFINLKIPRAERHRRVVAATENGEIFWVEGLRISEGFKLDNASVRRLKWNWSRLEAVAGNL